MVQVEDLILKENFAAKIVSKKNLKNKHEEYLIKNEIYILTSINHPNIIKFIEAFNFMNEYDEEYIIIFTKYCENEDLFDYLNENENEFEFEKENY